MVIPDNVHDSVAFDEVYDRVAEAFPKAETIVANSATVCSVRSIRRWSTAPPTGMDTESTRVIRPSVSTVPPAICVPIPNTVSKRYSGKSKETMRT